jgi:hypothetical protein
MKIGVFVAAFATLVLSVGPASATTSKSTGFSGYELFLGLTRSIPSTQFACDDTTITATRKTTGATFSGWTDTSSEWVSPVSSTGGLVTGSINYVGAPGLGNTVCITGGIWSWQLKSGKTFFGSVGGGYVQWPPSGASFNADCGMDVAVFFADVSVATGGSGTIVGCLNDQNGLIPPKIWGTVDLTLP